MLTAIHDLILGVTQNGTMLTPEEDAFGTNNPKE